MNCPHCNSQKIFRSHSRSLAEKLARLLLPVYFSRCKDCNWRGMRVRWKKVGYFALAVLSIGVLYYQRGLALSILRSVLGMFIPL